MNHTKLGRTGCTVSRLCLGTMNFGPQTTESDSHAIMDKAIELGINFFDTADVYGGKKGEGVTEQIIGNWFSGGNMRRENVVLATKVFGDMNTDNRDLTMKRGLSAVKIRRACENSLKRLKTDYIDLYQMHHIDMSFPWEECWQAFDTLVKQGKVIYVGSSNFAGWQIASASEHAKRWTTLGLVSEQSKYSLMSRAIELEVLPACKHFGLGVIPWSPLESGMLGGAMNKATEGRRAQESQQNRIEKEKDRLTAYESLCKEWGEAPANVALAWTLHHPAVTAPIIGPRTMQQLTDSIRAVEIKLSDDQLKQLDLIFPGPKGKTDLGISDFTKQEAPQAYAW